MEFDLYEILMSVLYAGGGGAAIALAIFRGLGKGWLSTQFERQLESFRHDKAKELEKLRAEIDGELNARIRLQEKQFEAIVGVWEALKSAQEKLLVSISLFQQYSDIRGMDDEDRDEYLGAFGLKNWQLKEILSAVDVQKAFQQTVDRKRFSEAATAFNEFDRKTRASELFFETETFAQIRLVCDKFNSSLVSRELGLEPGEHKMRREAWDEYDKFAVPEITKLVAELRKQLRN